VFVCVVNTRGAVPVRDCQWGVETLNTGYSKVEGWFDIQEKGREVQGKGWKVIEK